MKIAGRVAMQDRTTNSREMVRVRYGKWKDVSAGVAKR